MYTIYSDATADVVRALGIKTQRFAWVYAHGKLEDDLGFDIIQFGASDELKEGRNEGIIHVIDKDTRVKRYDVLVYVWRNKKLNVTEGFVVYKNDLAAIEQACTCLAFQSMDYTNFAAHCQQLFNNHLK